jgi:rod shape-determining protein RodA
MWQTLRHHLRYTSWPILASTVALMVIGVLAIRTSEQADPNMAGLALRQAIYAAVGLVVFLLVTLVPYGRLGRVAYPAFLVTLGLLVLVFFLDPVRGSHRWIDLKVIAVQPSEISKLTYIILLAWYLRYGDRYRRLTGLVAPFALTFLPMGLILMEPDLGTSLLFLPTLYFMLFMAGAKLRHLLGIVAVGTVLVLLPLPHRVPAGSDGDVARQVRGLSYYWTQREDGSTFAIMAAPLVAMERHPHQRDRIEGWLRQGDPDVIMNKGYHLHRSKMVMGAGRLTGRSGGAETDVYFTMLPDDHTDFIFSVIGGQWGFVGCLAVLALYGVVFLFGVEIAVITHDPFGRLLAVGVLALLFSQLLINVGMTMGLMPITGMTLPLVSYGGSSLVVNCAALGLLVNVGQRRPILLGRRPFEFGQKREKQTPTAAKWNQSKAARSSDYQSRAE